MREERPKSASERNEETAREMIAEAEPSFFADPKRLVQTAIAVVLLFVAIYVLIPRLFDLQDAIGKIKEGDPIWIAVGILCCVAMFAAYVALFRGVVGEKVIHLEWRESYEITMAGLAATRLFSAGGAGGILLTYWALRKAGMERRQSVCRMLAFLVVLYSVYLVALVVFGILLRTHVISGEAPLSGTVIPAALAGAVIVIGLLIALLPDDIERRIERHTSGRFGRLAQRLATAPATLAQGTRTAIAFIRHPSSGALAIGGAIGFWAANIAILWASFHAFDVSVPLGVVIQGFFLGMIANLFPLAPGGVGAVDAGMIGAFVLFGLPSAEVFAAVLTYRVIAFWLPIPPGIIAFFQLRNTVRRWEREGRERPDRIGVGDAETAPARS
ncbi:MAG TPA: lysylphosphatidylglycerol synthase transmembrane domain-containing protein [Solirubrobacterales bacterium]|nr:lysylphosphatidylglycerol synthase transmembrane domain-containing protein [Solirubrobacterales bacterium]